MKKKLEAKQSLRSNKVPSCRFWFFRIKKFCLNGRDKAVRRRGKPLVAEPFIEESDERNQQARCQVKRGQPFRSASNDVAQVCDRCNVDYQFLVCAPAAASTSGAAQPATSTSHAPQSGLAAEPDHLPKRRRLTKKTSGESKAPAATQSPKNARKWFYGSGALKEQAHAVMESFAVSFRKAYAMDFYITKYQGKMMEALTPLFQTMLGGIQRLEQQEKEEEEQRQAAAAADGDTADPPHKKRKTKDDLARRARRVCIRLSSMANRCFWLSACEVTVHVLTGGDCLESHHHLKIFTRQLQWAMQQCKRQLNREAVHEDTAQEQRSVQAVTVRAHASVEGHGAAQPVNDEDADDVEIIVMHACTTSTNTADDFAHRGKKLQSMPLYIYRMYR